MIPVWAAALALWLTFQAGAIVGYLICERHPPQRRWPVPPPGTLPDFRNYRIWKHPERRAA
jgi:hypothetical protein